MDSLKKKADPHNKLSGRIIAPGIAYGYAHLEEPFPSTYSSNIDSNAVKSEISRLEAAIERVRQHLEEHVRECHSPAEEDCQQIISSHLFILDDQQFFNSIALRIKNHFVSAERAVEEEFSDIAKRLGISRDNYLRARAEDLRDICQIVQKALLLGEEAFLPLDPNHRATVLFLEHLHPSAVIRARKFGAVAVITSSIAYTSHGAILLRASGIPSMGGVAISSTPFKEGTPLLVDAIHGEIHINPSEKILKKAFNLASQMEQTRADRSLPPLKAHTTDGREISLWANIDHPSQATLCFHYQLSGIGLFRTEFLVLDSGHIPDEEEQYQAYKHVVEQLEGRPLVLRTFDIGGDKVTASLHECAGANPSLGVRGIRRHLLRHPQELRTQLRAILRAAVGANVLILLPMVTNSEDILAARVHMEEVRAELEQERIPFNRTVRIGAMVEVPSAALSIAELLRNVDFVSIGTNDLLQYLTASDRDNPEVIAYQSLEASGLQILLKSIMEQARAMGRERDVQVCGEIASDPEGAKFLVQIGITSLSISPNSAPAVREAIETFRFSTEERKD